MDNEEFRRHGHAFVDWMADYLDGVENYPVKAQVRPGEIAAKLARSAPQDGEAMERIFADFQRDVMPGITHWQHPSFFAYFPANSSPPAVLAEMLVATLAPQCMLWETSPAATEMETRVLDWLRQMIGLPEGFRRRYSGQRLLSHPMRPVDGAGAVQRLARQRWRPERSATAVRLRLGTGTFLRRQGCHGGRHGHGISAQNSRR